jgi:transmembrane sensor
MTADRDAAPSSSLEHEAYDWVVRFVSGEACAADIKALKAWSARSPEHAAAFDEASKIWKTLDPARRRHLAEHGSVAPIVAGGRPFVPRRQHLGRRAFLGAGLAASVAGGAILVARPPLGLWPSWSELAADYRTKTGEQRMVMLADNVSVDMNTQTSIALRPSAGAPDQLELIAGEAIVSAIGGSRSITVLAGDGRVAAAKAQFNIRYDGDSACVACLVGDVRVEHTAAALPLPAGYQVIYSRSGLNAPVAIDPAVVAAWKDGVIIFDATPVAEVIAEVNRYQPGKIILTNAALGRERFNARFRIENMGRVVGQIEQVFGARARVLPGGITLLG